MSSTDRASGKVHEQSSHGLLIERFADRAALGQAAALNIATAVRDAQTRQPFIRIVFASAPSQAETLTALAVQPGIDWTRVVAFHMDEYIGLAADQPQRFSNWLSAHFLDLVPIGVTHLIDPGADAEREARRYAALLAQAPIDIVCMGIGVNGHIAFNDPPVADFNDPLAVKVVNLDTACRRQQVDEGCFASLDEVPRLAVTLTVPRLLDATSLFCMVPGAAKRGAVHAAVNGPLTTECPASVLRTHPHCTLYVDVESMPA